MSQLSTLAHNVTGVVVANGSGRSHLRQPPRERRQTVTRLASRETLLMREPLVPEFDAELYLMWEERQRERFELHHGFVVAFAGGTMDHDRIGHNIRVAFDRLFPAPCRSFGSDVKVRVDAATIYYADAGVICDDVPGSAAVVETPRVVAEVASPSTRAYDRIEKRHAYRGMSTLVAYLLVDTDRRQVEIDLRDAAGSWSTTTFDEEAIPLGHGILTFDEIYARSSLQR